MGERVIGPSVNGRPNIEHEDLCCEDQACHNVEQAERGGRLSTVLSSARVVRVVFVVLQAKPTKDMPAFGAGHLLAAAIFLHHDSTVRARLSCEESQKMIC